MKEDHPVIIALTGVIGSGKSTVADTLRSMGYPVISADVLARTVVEPGTQGLQKVAETFGQEVILPDGLLNRSLLGKIVFGDPKKRKDLEAILHPLIRDAFNQEASSIWNKKKPADRTYIFYDIPLYFETDYKHPWIQKVLTVFAPSQICIDRIMKRDSITQEEAAQRLATQMPIEEKVKRSDWKIDNSGTIGDLKNQLEAFLRTMEPLP